MIDLEEKLKEMQKKSEEITPEAYRDRVLSAARKAMQETGKRSVTVKSRKGNVTFAMDHAGVVHMFLDGEEIPAGKMAETIADIDGIGKTESLLHKAEAAVLSPEFARGMRITSVEATIKAAERQVKENNKMTNSLLKLLLQIVARGAQER